MTRTVGVLLGCAGVALLVGVAAVGLLAWHFSRSVQESHVRRLLREKVASVPFAPPADGRVAEERLRIFVDVCGRERRVQDKYKPSLDRLHRSNEQDTVDLNGTTSAFAFVHELQDERARALDERGMGLRELRWIRVRIGESPWERPPGPAPTPSPRAGDAANAALLERYRQPLLACLDLAEVRQNLDHDWEEVPRPSPS